jgi:signal transduction histidine kinase
MTNNLAAPPRVLLVDDNPTNLKVLSEALRGQGWTTLVAADGESAIEQAAYSHPDLILLDVMMPGIDGFETCRQLKANLATQLIPVIFMTALAETLDKVKGLELGAVDYIIKPFQQEEVIARVKLHLKLSQLTQTLEQHVEARTAELNDSLQQLQQAQLKLIQSEKMSMLGQLVAGIGHEINNPIGCIGGNILHVEGFAQDLLNLVHLYQQKYPQPDRDIDDLIEEIDLAYLSKDLPKLMKSMQEGVNRLQDISLSLRTFARSDIAHKVEFQVHEGIESTLMLLKHRTKANAQRPAIQIIEQFGKLPPISCYSGQLNQVFMNILANAIDALDDANHGRVYQDIVAHPNTIVISTSVHADRESVVIRIQDNGKGIPLELQGQIFEPTFTSKAVGKGTGLGLPISRQIVVEKHGGTLDCQSIIDAGTEFVIRLPI